MKLRDSRERPVEKDLQRIMAKSAVTKNRNKTTGIIRIRGHLVTLQDLSTEGGPNPP